MIKSIKIPIFFGEIIIIQTVSLKDIPKKWGIDFNFDGYAATCYKKNSKSNCLRIVIAFMEPTTPEIIAHECYHAVNYLFEHNGIQNQFGNDEPGAFILGWMVKKCHKYLKVSK